MRRIVFDGHRPPLQLMIALALTLAGLSANAQQQTVYSPISQQDLLQGLRNPSRWLTFSGDYTGQRHSPLKQLTPQNVAGLVPQWIFQTDVPGLPGRGLENTPLVVVYAGWAAVGGDDGGIDVHGVRTTCGAIGNVLPKCQML